MGDENILFAPADHIVSPDEEFKKTILTSDKRVKDTKGAVIFGVTPRYPETGYGYINKGALAKKVNDTNVFKVKKFVEKPDMNKAKEYVKTGDFLWNSGMFLFSQDRLLSSFKKYLKNIYNSFKNFDFGKSDDFCADKIRSFYSQLEKISIDNGLIEKEEGIELVECTFNWSDVGNWKALEEILPLDKNKNAIKGKHFLKDSKGLIADAGNKIFVSIFFFYI